MIMIRDTSKPVETIPQISSKTKRITILIS